MKKSVIQIVLSVFLGVYCVTALSEEKKPEYKELSWEDLMPPGWEPEPPQPSHMVPSFDFSDIVKDFFESEAPIVEELNNTYVKVPGYIIPTKYDDESISEVLLVPYIGACIHVPPPPANQMIYVHLEEPMSSGSLWDPVWVSGRMLTKKQVTEYAVAGYTMKNAFTSKYVFE